MTNMQEIAARQADLVTANEWARTPDYAEEFTMSHLVKWLSKRPLTTFATAHNDIDFLLSRCASLEALARELDEVVRLFNEDCEDIPSEWLPVRARCWVAMDKVNASPLLAELRRADLSHPLVSELTGEKEGGE